MEQGIDTKQGIVQVRLFFISMHLLFLIFKKLNSVTSFFFMEKESKPSRKRSSCQTGEESLSKAVIKNITRILEDLLKDYEKTERPSVKDGKVLKIYPIL